MRFANKTALVCGAATGIGAAVARLLAREGARQVLTGAQPEALADVAAQCGAQAMQCDVRDEAAVQRVVQYTLQAHGRIDVLVNAAGVVSSDDAAVIEDAAWQQMHEVNLGGTMRLMRAVLPSMLQRQSGSIVNIASVAAFNASAGMASYSASKAGVVALTRSAASAYGAAGIRINALCPGWVDTPMSQREMAELASAWNVSCDEARARTVGRVALGRMAHPDEIAAACAFLASEQASFVTGTALVVDGGARVPASARAA